MRQGTTSVGIIARTYLSYTSLRVFGCGLRTRRHIRIVKIPLASMQSTAKTSAHTHTFAYHLEASLHQDMPAKQKAT